jgi:hypothetical protein
MDEYPITLETVVSSDTEFSIKRLRCPGGFLVITKNLDSGDVATVFIPEPRHMWPLVS